MKHLGFELVALSLVVAVVDAATLAAWGTIIVAVSGLAGVILLGIQNAYVARAAVRRADEQAKEAADERAAMRLQQISDKAELALSMLEASHKIDGVKVVAETVEKHVNSSATKQAEKIEILLTKADVLIADNERLRKELADERQASALAAQAAIAAAAKATSESVAKSPVVVPVGVPSNHMVQSDVVVPAPVEKLALKAIEAIENNTAASAVHTEAIAKNTAATKADIEDLKDKP